jgi:signal transduction histidine kinase
MTVDTSPDLQDAERLAALQRTELLDSPPDHGFDRLTRLAARLLHAPVALVSLVDEDRQYFKSCIGLPEPWASERGTPLSHSFCQHAVLARAPLIIEDARVHPLVQDNLAIPDLNVVAYAGIPIFSPDGHAIGSFCVIDAEPRAWTDDQIEILRELATSVETEVALRVRAKEAQQALKAHDELLSIVAHDLKNPVGVISAYADLLQRRLPPRTPQDVDRLQSGLRQIMTAAFRLGGQIEELQDIAYLQVGRALALQRQPTDLVMLVRQVVADQQQTTRHHTIMLTTTESELIAPVDGLRIERALTNLIANAIKFSPSGGDVRVTLTTERDDAGGWAVVQVQDDGLGIPAADLDHIFLRFHRGTNVVERIAGTGIGLTGAQQIVEQHGGTIVVASEEGRGSTFTIRLPLAS